MASASALHEESRGSLASRRVTNFPLSFKDMTMARSPCIEVVYCSETCDRTNQRRPVNEQACLWQIDPGLYTTSNPSALPNLS